MEQMARTTRQIGAAIKRSRKAKGLTQSELGARTGLRQSTISTLENGEPGTQLRTMVDVLMALDLELSIRERTKTPVDIEDLF